MSIALVLVAALLHAVWNALVKSGEHNVLAMASVSVGAAFVSAFFLPFTSFPDAESWNYLLVAVILHLGYGICLGCMYRGEELSRVYPIARGTGPLLVACASGPFIAEQLSFEMWLGVILVSGGILILTFGKGRVSRAERRGLIFAVVTGAFIASYTLVDGLGVRSAGGSMRYIAWVFLLDGLSLGTVVFLWYRSKAICYVKKFWRQGLAGGVLCFGGYGLVLWAMTLNKVALVASLRETSVIFAAIIGAVFLKESFGRERILAAFFVGVGAILLQLGA